MAGLVVAAYLLGAVPFGWLLARWLRGVDLRSAGSGNIGATNAARVLGFRYFWLVFALDFAKGLLPTLAAPRLFEAVARTHAPPALAVAAALAAVLGHNFPVYLRFRGGKGAATSLGLLFGLDPVAAAAAAVGFVAFLLVTRYVSASSMLAGLVFFLAHFQRVDAPWSREQQPMSVLTVGLLALLVARHRTNLGRLARGAEPRVSLRRRPAGPRGGDDPGGPDRPGPSGRVSVAALVALALTALGVVAGWGLWRQAIRPNELILGPVRLAEVARAATGHQRAERVAFTDAGRLLAVTCPRYNRLVLYRVDDPGTLLPSGDLELGGKPVALAATRGRVYVLERPAGDSRHVEPGWVEAFDLRGGRVGPRTPVGFYPDDLALTADGRTLYVLTSGRAEGGADRPPPGLRSYAVDPATASLTPLGSVAFHGPADDPVRLTLSDSGRCAVATLAGVDVAAALDLADPAAPRIIGRSPLAGVDAPYLSRSEDDRVVMPSESDREGVPVSIAGLGDCLVTTLPRGSGLELFGDPDRSRPALGRLTLHAGALNLGATRPTGLAYSPERGLIAVANRSGGVHLLALTDGGRTTPVVAQVGAADDSGGPRVDPTVRRVTAGAGSQGALNR